MLIVERGKKKQKKNFDSQKTVGKIRQILQIAKRRIPTEPRDTKRFYLYRSQFLDNRCCEEDLATSVRQQAAIDDLYNEF